MDWRSVRFDWNQARAFLVAAEEGSFSAAARALGLTQPTIGRQVAALEEALGVVLFERVGNGLELTATGVELVEQVRAMGEAASRVSLTATGRAEALDGTVCVTASEVISAYLLPPIIAALRVEHPGVEIELVASNTARDLRRREADIAVRNFRPTEPDLFAQKIGDSVAHMYATPGYLERLGGATTPASLSRAEFFAFDRTDLLISGLNARGLALTPANFPIVSESHVVQWQLCRQGVGICVMMQDIGDPDPAVVRVLPEVVAIEVPIWLVSHRELRTSRRMRVVHERLAAGLRAGGRNAPEGVPGR